ncbi:MAG: hypothetical protein AW08_03776 [Candidatus Accumulibacter adjunctus]|uniref:Uncharacterized protein n=1 Tax=Candidatus Accumulibacter adjunctus TaxID=1454001 RepID=A0A011M3P1_9PROT|nr:MAG: hypothetical protein AW08_03776 [Candidatus Accumulibacter adjunctus]
MLNQPALNYIALSQGRALPAVFAEVTGLSERTLRNKANAEPRPGTLARVRQHSIAHARDTLAKIGLSPEDSEAWLGQHPGMTKRGALYAGMVYETQVNRVMAFPHTLQLALAIDKLSTRLWAARRADRLEEFRQALRESPLADAGNFAGSSDEAAEGCPPKLLARLESVASWAGMDEIVRTVAVNTLLSLLARWDVEFCSQFFSGYEARPFFALVLPRLDPKAGDADGCGELPRRRGMFQYPVRRCLEVLACMGEFVRRERWPDSVPSVKRMSIDSGEPEANLINWRDSTKAFTRRDFARLWEHLCSRGRGSSRHCEAPPPWPLYVATVLWQKSLSPTSKDGSRSIFVVDDWYLGWWRTHYDTLAATGCAFGTSPWPPCFTAV